MDRAGRRLRKAAWQTYRGPDGDHDLCGALVQDASEQPDYTGRNKPWSVMETEPPCQAAIIRDYAKWTALSALRSGAPIKSREAVYSVLDTLPFGSVFEGSVHIRAEESDAWHRESAEAMGRREKRLNTGWAVKLLNVYLKTAAYVGDLGRPGLRAVLHPPIDGSLWAGLAERFAGNALLIDTHHVARIKDITSYDCYSRIILGCRAASREMACDLIELEQLWQGLRWQAREEASGEDAIPLLASTPAVGSKPRKRH